MRAASLACGATEALGVMAAFVVGGLGLAVLERGARSGADAYPARAMAAAPEDPRQGGQPGDEDGRSADAAATPAVWLVDGFNVLCAGVLRGRERSAFWSEASRRKLLERVARFDDPNARVIVVFDGEGPAVEPPTGGPESVFASSADDWIVARLREPASGRVAVVTADRQLAGRARHRGAEVVSPLRFLARCEPACPE